MRSPMPVSRIVATLGTLRHWLPQASWSCPHGYRVCSCLHDPHLDVYIYIYMLVLPNVAAPFLSHSSFPIACAFSVACTDAPCHVLLQMRCASNASLPLRKSCFAQHLAPLAAVATWALQRGALPSTHPSGHGACQGLKMLCLTSHLQVSLKAFCALLLKVVAYISFVGYGKVVKICGFFSLNIESLGSAVCIASSAEGPE
jgi:hypothetical protein